MFKSIDIITILKNLIVHKDDRIEYIRKTLYKTDDYFCHSVFYTRHNFIIASNISSFNKVINKAMRTRQRVVLPDNIEPLTLFSFITEHGEIRTLKDTLKLTLANIEAYRESHQPKEDEFFHKEDKIIRESIEKFVDIIYDIHQNHI